jgi:hypothetical protein
MKLENENKIKSEEIEQLKVEIANLKYLMKLAFDERDYFYSKNQQLNAKVAMLHKAVYELRRTYSGEFTFNETNKLFAFADEALTATEADVSKWLEDRESKLNARVAMMREALGAMVTYYAMDNDEWSEGTFKQVDKAIAATEADVTKWVEDRDKKVLEAAIERLNEFDSDELFVETAIDIVRGE